MSRADVRPFAAFDIDGTLIRWQLYHAITDEMAARGHVKQADYQSMHNARMAWKKRSGSSFREYELQVVDIYQSMLKTVTYEQYLHAIDAVFEEYKDQVYTYTRDLIKRLRGHDYLLFAISGSPKEIVAKVADYYGFDDFVGRIDDHKDNAFTGESYSPIFKKDQTLKDLASKHNLSFAGSLAIGDSHSDVAMLQLVEQPVAFNPELSLYEYAKTRGWKIVIERKNVVFELESRDGNYQLVKTNP